MRYFPSFLQAPLLQLIVAQTIALPSGCLGAVYFVDYSSGSDANPGVSPTAPFQRAPGDPLATGIAAAVALQPGDAVWLRRGVTYVGTITIDASGSEGKPIVYDGDAWGTGGKAILTTRNAPGSQGMRDGGRARNWIEIRNISFADIGGLADDDPIWTTPDPENPANMLTVAPPGGAGLALSGGGSDILIANCTFEEIGQWIPKKPINGVGHISGTGIDLQNNSRVTITDCLFTRMKIGLSVKSRPLVSDITIDRCEFRNFLTWCIDIAPRSNGSVISNITIRASKIHDYHEYDSGNWQAWGEKPHTDGIFLRNAGMDGYWHNVVIDGCHFYADWIGQSEGGTATIYLSEGPSATIRNCLFNNTRHSMGDVVVAYAPRAVQKQTINILNNTFYGSTRPLFLRNGTDSTTRSVRILNNIIYRATTNRSNNHIYADSLATIVELDHNLYFADVPEVDMYVLGGLGYLTFAALKSRGLEQSGSWGNPLWKNVRARDLQTPSANDFQLLQASPALDAGRALTSDFSADYAGYQRPESGWDLGALEYSSPMTPRNVRVSAK